MIRCDIGACPKVYHLACIGKDDCFHTDCHFDFFHVATKLTFLRILGALHSLSLPLIDSCTIFYTSSGKETFPRGKWTCPWHYCADCGKLADAWCIHCPNAYCRLHKREFLTQHRELASICNEHEDEIDFMLDCLRMGGGLAEILPSPNPTKVVIFS